MRPDTIEQPDNELLRNVLWRSAWILRPAPRPRQESGL